MRVVGVKVLKNKLSEYLKLAASGERILVTDRDRVVAELGPPQEGTAAKVNDALLAEAMRKGWIRAPLLERSGPPPSRPVAPFDELMRELDELRADRF